MKTINKLDETSIGIGFAVGFSSALLLIYAISEGVRLSMGWL